MSAQAQQALVIANRRRSAKAAARNRVADPGRLASSLLAFADEMESRSQLIPNVSVWDATGWVFKSTEEHRWALLGAAGCSLGTTVGTLTDRQLEALVGMARQMAESRGQA